MNFQAQRVLISLGIVVIAVANMLDNGAVSLIGFLITGVVICYGSVQDAMK